MDPGRIDLIYPAFDASRFRVDSRPPKEFEDLKESFGLPRDRPVFLFVGRMNPQKRPLHFVDLACRLDASEFRASFFMLGDGELAPEVDAAIAQSPAGLLRRLPFTDRVPEILAMAEGLVITSEYEGLPIAMLEALAMGVPVLSTDVGDVRLILEEYKTGAIVEGIGDPLKLVEAFQAWRSALPAYRRAAQDAASKIATRFSAATLAAQYEESWLKAHRTLRGREMRPLASKASGRT